MITYFVNLRRSINIYQRVGHFNLDRGLIYFRGYLGPDILEGEVPEVSPQCQGPIGTEE